MSESRSKQLYVAEESQKSEKEADPYWWSAGSKPSKEMMDRYKDAKPQLGRTTLPIDISSLEGKFPLQGTNDGTERVYHEFTSPEAARLFSKSYHAALKYEDIKLEQKSEQPSAPVVEDFPFDEQCFVLSPNWKPKQ